jgi:hypothetical protein
MQKNLEAVKRRAKDLRTESPRNPEEELGGFRGAARCVDKCRAALLGWQGEYIYGCPMDQQFLNLSGIGANELKAFVATGASDEQIANWIEEHAHAGSPH